MSKLGKTLLLVAGISAMMFAPAFTRSAPALVQGMKPLLIRDFDAPAVRPFQTSLCFGNLSCSSPSTFTVPTSTNGGDEVQRLVLEFVSAKCLWVSSLATPFIFELELETTAGGVAARHNFVPVQELQTEEVLHVHAADAVRIYADPGSLMSFRSPVTVGNGACGLTVSGHFVVE